LSLKLDVTDYFVRPTYVVQIFYALDALAVLVSIDSN
jgi:hypothetical protein